MAEAPTRCGFVAVIGEPNAGKSTLVNAMVGTKVSIVTHKVQTTRTRIRGIAIEGPAQIVFVDTPGLFQPRRRLDRAMVAAAWAGVGDADIVLVMVEAHRGVTPGVERMLEGLAGHVPSNARVALVINKIDRVRRDALLALAADLNARHGFDETFMISAENEMGTADLTRWIDPSVRHHAACWPLRIVPSMMRHSARRPTYWLASRLVTQACSGAPSV